MIKANQNIIQTLRQSQGIDVSKYDETFLKKSIGKRIAETQCNSTEEYCIYLEQHEIEGKHFHDSLQISYSEFFRNPLTFSVLERVVLPSIALQKQNTNRKEIRIWSAACAAGQESYSLAMLLEDIVTLDGGKIKYRIFATDQSQEQILAANKGQYTANAINNLSFKRVNQWFIQQGDTYFVKPELKANIYFSVFDLFSEQLNCPPASIFGDFDLVVCANLLFYYKPEYQKIILQKTGGCRAKGGYIICGETERDILLRHNLIEAFPQSGIFTK